MKRVFFLILTSCCFLMACNKNSNPTPQKPSKPLQIVVSNITTTLTIYNLSITDQSAGKLFDIYAQTQNDTYSVNVRPGDTLTVHYFLELEGPKPATKPVVSVIYDGVPMVTVTNDAGIVSGTKSIIIP